MDQGRIYAASKLTENYKNKTDNSDSVWTVAMQQIWTQAEFILPSN